MLKIKDYFKFLVVLVAVFVVSNLAAQDIDDAKNLAREGKTALDAEQFDVAALKMEESIDILEDLWEEEEDEEAEAMMKKLKQMMPNIYLKAGLALATQGELDEAIKTLEKCNSSASSMNMTDVLSKSQGLMSKIYLSIAGDQYTNATADESNTDMDLLNKSLENSSKAIEMDPASIDAYRLKVGILLITEDGAALAETVRALQTVNGKTAEKNEISLMASTYFYNEGLKAKQSTNYEAAIEKLNLCIEFDKQNTDAYYLLTFIFNAQSEWEKAIAIANEGLLYEKPDKQDRLYFELGTAYYKTGDKSAACDAYSKVVSGKFSDRAKYEMKEVVKCD
ncbi:MAG: tetratricopeptide repeat protein [Bacteroidales bacterium]|nr:tetratricopeptide repeat protein [Bacteroidales bacterium]